MRVYRFRREVRKGLLGLVREVKVGKVGHIGCSSDGAVLWENRMSDSQTAGRQKKQEEQKWQKVFLLFLLFLLFCRPCSLAKTINWKSLQPSFLKLDSGAQR